MNLDHRIRFSLEPAIGGEEQQVKEIKQLIRDVVAEITPELKIAPNDVLWNEGYHYYGDKLKTNLEKVMNS